MPSQAAVHRTLVGARAILAYRGLAKGALGPDLDGRVCIRGAMNETVTGDPLVWADDELHRACEQAMGFNGTMEHYEDPNSAVTFNNAPERTLEEVLDRLDQAIAATRRCWLGDTKPEATKPEGAKPETPVFVPEEWQKETVNA